jgi:hypothetical protein
MPTAAILWNCSTVNFRLSNCTVISILDFGLLASLLLIPGLLLVYHWFPVFGWESITGGSASSISGRQSLPEMHYKQGSL